MGQNVCRGGGREMMMDNTHTVPRPLFNLLFLPTIRIMEDGVEGDGMECLSVGMSVSKKNFKVNV